MWKIILIIAVLFGLYKLAQIVMDYVTIALGLILRLGGIALIGVILFLNARSHFIYADDFIGKFMAIFRSVFVAVAIIVVLVMLKSKEGREFIKNIIYIGGGICILAITIYNITISESIIDFIFNEIAYLLIGIGTVYVYRSDNALNFLYSIAYGYEKRGVSISEARCASCKYYNTDACIMAQVKENDSFIDSMKTVCNQYTPVNKG